MIILSKRNRLGKRFVRCLSYTGKENANSSNEDSTLQNIFRTDMMTPLNAKRSTSCPNLDPSNEIQTKPSLALVVLFLSVFNILFTAIRKYVNVQHTVLYIYRHLRIEIQRHKIKRR